MKQVCKPDVLLLLDRVRVTGRRFRLSRGHYTAVPETPISVLELVSYAAGLMVGRYAEGLELTPDMDSRSLTQFLLAL